MIRVAYRFQRSSQIVSFRSITLMYEVSDVLVINKIDALPVFDFRKDYVEACARRLNPQIKIFYISAKTGEGMKELADYLLEKIQEVNA